MNKKQTRLTFMQNQKEKRQYTGKENGNRWKETYMILEDAEQGKTFTGLQTNSCN